MTLRALFLTSCCLILGFAPAAGQPGDGGDDPFAGLLFPPDLVLGHQGAIGLSEGQRQALIAEVTAAQADFIPLQVELAAAGERLQALLAESRVDEELAIETAIQVMELEARVKRRHLELAIRIKNGLSEEQQALLAGKR